MTTTAISTSRYRVLMSSTREAIRARRSIATTTAPSSTSRYRVRIASRVELISTRYRDVEIAVVVIIGYRDCAYHEPLDRDVEIGEDIIAVVPVDPGGRDVSRHAAGEHDIQIAVVVNVDPLRRAGVDLCKCSADIDKCPVIITVNLAERTVAVAGHQEIKVAVVVIVSPGCRGRPGPSESRLSVGERAVVVAIEDRIKRVARVGRAGDEKIEVPVVVIVHPGDRSAG